VLGDEEPGCDLVCAKVLVEQQQHLDLAGGQLGRDLVRNATAQPTALAHALEQAARNRARQGGLAAGDATQERSDPLGRLALQQIAGCPGADRGEQVLLRARRGENDHLAGGCSLADARQRHESVDARHRQVEQDDVGLQLSGALDCLAAVARLCNDVEVVLVEERRERFAGERMVVDDEHALVHSGLIGSEHAADKRDVHAPRADTYRSLLISELVLAAVLAIATALVMGVSGLDGYALPGAKLAADTAIAVVATLVAILVIVKVLVEGRTLDLVLAAGFLVAALGSFAFGVVPLLPGEEPSAREEWAAILADIGAAGLIALAPFLTGRTRARRAALALGGLGTLAVLAGAWAAAEAAAGRIALLDDAGGRALAPTFAYALLSLLAVVAAIGFGWRFRRYGRDLDRWLALAMTLVVFADLHYVLTSTEYLLYNDFLRLLAYGVLLVGVWSAYSHAEFGRAVGEERARVAREIHDGLAQYLFALSTHVSMLEGGAPLEDLLPRLKQASIAAQQEARFAVLALSSASGTAPFDAALRRYVDVLTADGALEVDLDIDPDVRLAPDEQIEVFRIVQEGLANIRHHASTRRAEVAITHRGGRRVVVVRDHGIGFTGEQDQAGQGLKNMRQRAASIEGRLTLRSQPGVGTAIEVVLRPA
jgi:signal transduction histidine kinase